MHTKELDEFEHPEVLQSSTHNPAAKQGLESKVFKEQLALHNRCVELARMVGSEDQNEEVASLVLLEMRHVGGYILAQRITGLVREWHKTKNPYAVDWAMYLCEECKLQPPPSLSKVAAEVAKARFRGDLSGTQKKLVKQQRRDQAFIMMMNLIYYNDTLSIAASKTASRYARCFPEESLKASTLELEYTKKIRNSGTEQKHFDAWENAERDNDPDMAEARRYWTALKDSMPMADWEIKGVRR